MGKSELPWILDSLADQARRRAADCSERIAAGNASLAKVSEDVVGARRALERTRIEVSKRFADDINITIAQKRVDAAEASVRAITAELSALEERRMAALSEAQKLDAQAEASRAVLFAAEYQAIQTAKSELDLATGRLESATAAVVAQRGVVDSIEKAAANPVVWAGMSAARDELQRCEAVERNVRASAAEAEHAVAAAQKALVQAEYDRAVEVSKNVCSADDVTAVVALERELSQVVARIDETNTTANASAVHARAIARKLGINPDAVRSPRGNEARNAVFQAVKRDREERGESTPVLALPL